MNWITTGVAAYGKPVTVGLDLSSSPVVDGRVSSGYGPRQRPSGVQFHAGLDIVAARGTPVRSVLNGVVTHAITDENAPHFRGYGRVVAIQHEKRGVYTFYAHLDRLTVSRGQTVRAGQQIGTVGITGITHSHPHLHFEVRRRTDGRSPVPSRYAQWTIPPMPWLNSVGIGTDRNGRLIDNFPIPTDNRSERLIEPAKGMFGAIAMGIAISLVTGIIMTKVMK